MSPVAPTTLPITYLGEISDLPHLTRYTVAACDRPEPFWQRMLIIDPTLDEPTLVMRDGWTDYTHANIRGLALPSLDGLTLELAQMLVSQSHGDISVRELLPAQQSGAPYTEHTRGPLVHMPWGHIG